MGFCPNCGAKHKESAHYCTACGTKLSISIAAPSIQAEQASDPSLTKNIVLLSLSVFFIMIATLMANMYPSEPEVPPTPAEASAFYLSVSGALAFFAVRSSTDHLDTKKAILLKTTESFGLAVISFLCLFFIQSNTLACSVPYLSFVILFGLIAIFKIKKTSIASRSTTEKVLLAFSIVVLVIASLFLFGSLIGILVRTL